MSPTEKTQLEEVARPQGNDIEQLAGRVHLVGCIPKIGFVFSLEVVVGVSEFSDQLWLEFSLGQAEQNGLHQGPT